jgi:5'-nucleotidase
MFACGSDKDHDRTSAQLRVMVTNDDGYAAAGINALVETLWARPELEVHVVAPADDKSGTGGTTTPGVISATDEHTVAGRAATAVAGYPADCLTWAIDQQGLAQRPDLVISGINHGDNVGPVVDISGTVGAARAAAAHGIPALAVSEVMNGESTDFIGGAAFALNWLDAHRTDIVAGDAAVSGLLENLNIPSCTQGTIRGVVRVPIAATNDGVAPDCTSALMEPSNDVEALNAGFVAVSVLPPRPGEGGP